MIDPGAVVGDLIADVVRVVTTRGTPEAIWLDRELWDAYMVQAEHPSLPVFDARTGRMTKVPVRPLGAR